jgi:glycosyltransferase involved in cell wall biosynthesis
MKILHVFRTPVGGLFRHVCDLATEQTARGHQVGVLYDSSTGDILAGARLQTLAASCALGIHAIPMSRALSPRDIQGLLATKRLIRNLGADVVHGHGAKGGAFARLAAGMIPATAGRPRAFYTPHGGSLHYDPRSMAGAVFLGAERYLERWSDGLIFESAYSAEAYAAKVGGARFGGAGAPARIVPNGLQATEFAPVAASADAADFLFIGELRHLKGVDVLLHALARLQDARPASALPVSAVIVGAGPDALAFQSLARDLGLSGRVHFAGAMPARQAFALGRTLVVPSRAESFPYIVLEAAAAGLPMIATAVGGIPEITAGSGVGLVPPDDAGALAAAMAAALYDADAMTARAASLQACVAARFSVGRMTDSILGFYAEARAPVTLRHSVHSGAN